MKIHGKSEDFDARSIQRNSYCLMLTYHYSKILSNVPTLLDFAVFEALLPEERFLDSPGRSLLLDPCLVDPSAPSLPLAFSALL